MQIPELIVPPALGAFSALGVVASDLKRDYSRTLYADVAALDPARVAAVLAEMEASASEMLETAGIKPDQRSLWRAVDVRYRRQAYELTVPLAAGPITRESLDALATGFDWNFSTDPADAEFVFVPPEGAVQVELNAAKRAASAKGKGTNQ